MDDTTIVSDNTGVVQARLRVRSAVSWSAIIAGVFTAVAVTIIVISLGSGIGLAIASPFSSSPSAGTFTVIGAVWLVFAQAVGYATGGFVTGRLRTNPDAIHSSEVKFRDGANGLILWAIGVVLSSLVLIAATGIVGKATGDTLTTTASSAGAPLVDYFTDTLLRSNPQKASLPNGADLRDQVKRIIVNSVAQGSLSSDDRTYLAEIVSAQTGMSADDAQHRVDNIVNHARDSMTKAADTVRKAGAYFSFWTFMSLLFGAACATLGGILGGELRDDWASRRAIPMAAR